MGSPKLESFLYESLSLWFSNLFFFHLCLPTRSSSSSSSYSSTITSGSGGTTTTSYKILILHNPFNFPFVVKNVMKSLFISDEMRNLIEEEKEEEENVVRRLDLFSSFISSIAFLPIFYPVPHLFSF